MPSISNAESREGDVEVLVTGFGPFGKVKENPSFICTKELHGAYLDPIKSIANGEAAEPGQRGRRIHVQVIQTATAYAHVLDLVPRLHGAKPSAPEAKPYLDPQVEQPDPKTGLGPQGNGSPFPEGYRDINVPAKGYFDHVIHVGVGMPGSVAVETSAHKRGYQLPDVKSEKAPIATDQSETVRRDSVKVVESASEKHERSNLGLTGTEKDAITKDPIRGFGKGYEDFPDSLATTNDVSSLVSWLQQERSVRNVRQSTDAGRFLCDYIFYCSLAEAQRSNHQTQVQFIHVPGENQPYTMDELHSIVKDIVTWIASK